VLTSKVFKLVCGYEKNVPFYIFLSSKQLSPRKRERFPPAKKSRPMIGLFLPLFTFLIHHSSLYPWEERHLSRYISSAIKWK
jgi:hypothetical protein